MFFLVLNTNRRQSDFTRKGEQGQNTESAAMRNEFNGRNKSKCCRNSSSTTTSTTSNSNNCCECLCRRIGAHNRVYRAPYQPLWEPSHMFNRNAFQPSKNCFMNCTVYFFSLDSSLVLFIHFSQFDLFDVMVYRFSLYTPVVAVDVMHLSPIFSKVHLHPGQ